MTRDTECDPSLWCRLVEWFDRALAALHAHTKPGETNRPSAPPPVPPEG